MNVRPKASDFDRIIGVNRSHALALGSVRRLVSGSGAAAPSRLEARLAVVRFAGFSDDIRHAHPPSVHMHMPALAYVWLQARQGRARRGRPSKARDRQWSVSKTTYSEGKRL